LKDPSQTVSRKLRYKAIQYVLLDDDFYYCTIDGVLLKCLSVYESKSVMDEVHEDVCGAHQSAYKMKWVIQRSCFEYYKRCPQECQRFGNVQRTSA
jgi:hypothetical protein